VAKGKRGRETTADMVRSLGLILAIVVVVWFFARPPASDEKAIRVVDPTEDVQAFTADVPGGAVPRAMPAGWKTTVANYDRTTGLLRLGWVTPAGHYAEYAAAAHPPPGFLTDYTGDGPRGASIDIGGTAWTQYRAGDAISLVRAYGTTTVVLGTHRATATLDELRVLAGRLAA
jgi:hypothetical protein